MEQCWRSLTTLEEAIINRLLQEDFPAVEVLRRQFVDLQARPIARELSVELKVDNQVRAILKTRMPIAAEYCDDEPYKDLGQIHVHILLHVRGGLMSELEFYKDDGTSITRLPDVSELRIFVAQES
jgi:hypothetical protein